MLIKYTPLVLLGAVAGVLGGMLGIGGGTVIVPALIIICAMPHKIAQGTSLMCAALIAISGLLPYTIHEYINYLYGIIISIGAVIGALVGSHIMKRTHTKILKNIFVVLLIYVSANMIYSGLKGTDMNLFAVYDLSQHVILMYSLLFGIGILAGTLSGLLGIGGGMVMVPCMLAIGIGQKMAQGISLFCMIPTAVTGVIAQRKAGNVDFKSGAIVGTSSVLFSIIGANITSVVDGNYLKMGFGIFMIFVAFMMSRTGNK